ncbi:hypothetical protein QO002_005560 [Pararhizobium capsulatum DSM 1112]|uniref:Uncharacterized protein n=1 Tax=Pararhizobium capsulatum DSM 1112 TaxID=1121113 RepID=A0ABU0BYM2_9HYPH|nr:hypothetical protein [Pararhizobium capsulatum]MDQ0323354.1 hypothetical protein [Pararhizobium capsulatum DSM 1112]
MAVVNVDAIFAVVTPVASGRGEHFDAGKNGDDRSNTDVVKKSVKKVGKSRATRGLSVRQASLSSHDGPTVIGGVMT